MTLGRPLVWIGKDSRKKCTDLWWPGSRCSSTNAGILPTCNNCLSGLCWANTSANVTVCLFSTREESSCSCLWATSTRKWQRTRRARQLTHQDEKTCGSECVFTATYSLFSLLSLSFSQALASHRAYLLTARIPAKVRNSNWLEFWDFSRKEVQWKSVAHTKSID